MNARAVVRDEVTIKHEENERGDYVRYFADVPLTETQTQVTIAKSDLVGLAFVAQSWHGGQWSALYKLSCADFSYETLRSAERELVRALARANVSADEYAEASEAVATLQRVTSHFDV